MTQEYYSIITNSGLAKQAAASLGGAPIDLTHLAVGDSNGTSYNPVATATALQNERYRTTLTYVQIDGSNPNQLIVEAVIDETVGPFYVREVGVFDSSGALFAIGKFPETFKPNLPSGSGKKLYVRMILAFASSPQVNLVQSENLNYDPNFSTNVFAAIALKLAKAANLSDVADAAQARNNLGLQIGVNVQAFAANLAALAGLTGAVKKIPIFTNAGQMAVADLFSNRNAIINGDFNIWQRNTSFVGIADGAYSADRWVYYKSGAMVHDIVRSSDVPSVAQAGRVFNYSMLIDCQTADTSISASDIAVIQQRIEGFNWAPLAQRVITLSFWVKATKAGVYCVSIGNGSPFDRAIVKEYTINQSDTWEYKTLTFAASPSSGTWDFGNSIGARVGFTLAAGSNYQVAPDAWQNGDYRATSNQVNACDSTSNNFRLCGVQIEAGSIATPFEQRSYQHELMLCQRYYQFVYSGSSFVGAIHSTAGTVCIKSNFRQQMRTTPTIGQTGILNAQNGTGFNTAQSSPAINAAYASFDSCYVTVGNFNTSGQTNSIACSCPTVENNSNCLTLNAEL